MALPSRDMQQQGYVCKYSGLLGLDPSCQHCDAPTFQSCRWIYMASIRLYIIDWTLLYHHKDERDQGDPEGAAI